MLPQKLKIVRTVGDVDIRSVLWDIIHILQQLADEDLPWALVMRPPGTGTGSGGMSKTIHFNQGDTVIGFFLDNENAQQPIIMGAIGNSKYAAKNGEKLPFGNFTGYNEVMEPPSKKVRTQSESSDIQEQPSPQSNTPDTTKTDNPVISSADGIKITNPCGGNDSPKDAKGSQQLTDIKMLLSNSVIL